MKSIMNRDDTKDLFKFDFKNSLSEVTREDFDIEKMLEVADAAGEIIRRRETERKAKGVAR
ncbi:MAG: hypothetical protein COX44_02600 [Candidatus Portnoybacteria bacterium CG23_combo_of_CG06-09_8_20_14_all_37_13]|uniref:Uncharacterized protein n=1 Tax=Candidatus Portnoybacteria bacterium CG23_combo_of_CG06-09_8_20_14_all_37_13 TaxID=1974819 RepID=A0A2G9YDZ3_9BACT|nr:MAG: hypothetical protein COX44_02600 [Candidatus Portnoybacteria bacterium CG23_combo_of_CG06-09_8_20_14_all_37_13]